MARVYGNSCLFCRLVALVTEPDHRCRMWARRAGLAMHSAGILEDIEAAIETADKAAQIEWEYATEVRRDHPLIEAIGSQLQLSAEQIDALFIAADQID